MAVDRSEEFQELIVKFKEESKNEPELRNRTKRSTESETSISDELFAFSRAFLSECTLTVILIL